MLEGAESDRLFIVKEGKVSLYKKFARQSLTEKNCFTESKIMDLEKSEIFGADKLIFNHKNTCTVKISSVKATIISIKITDFKQYFKHLMPDLELHLKLRNDIIQDQIKRVKKNFVHKNLTNLELEIWNSLPQFQEISWET